MNKLYVYTASLLMVCAVTSCDNNIPDEQFAKKVSLTKNGMQKYNIDFTDEGILDLNIPVLVSGTSKNDQNIEVTIALDPDTLANYNFERYRNNQALYYQLPSENMYHFPKGATVTIPAGVDYSIIPLTIDLRNFDLYNNYILPLQINKVSAYEIAWSSYSKLLINLNISNFISGSYTVSGNVWEASMPDQKLAVSSSSLFTLGANKCYLYMGDIAEDNINRALYTMTIEVDKAAYEDRVDNSTGAEIRRYTNITLGSKNTDKELHSEGDAWVEQERTDDPYDNKLENLVTRVYMKYSYMDLNDPTYPVKKFFEGTLSHTQSVDKETGKVMN
ncbi:DUF4973 domain-containing protein [Bacteroides sp.]|uniref:DUF4973 domain-containing protein n=1 Tax=Bacteroides sp. TaxID=29523 RepID=UPI002625C9B0|nr:DUF4973 domain-containing protein [Bacteroides sp.]MDD3036983.1 DUF4973 domain-containing protein [Bacteroides sp.]